MFSYLKSVFFGEEDLGNPRMLQTGYLNSGSTQFNKGGTRQRTQMSVDMRNSDVLRHNMHSVAGIRGATGGSDRFARSVTGEETIEIPIQNQHFPNYNPNFHQSSKQKSGSTSFNNHSSDSASQMMAIKAKAKAATTNVLTATSAANSNPQQAQLNIIKPPISRQGAQQRQHKIGEHGSASFTGLPTSKVNTAPQLRQQYQQQEDNRKRNEEYHKLMQLFNETTIQVSNNKDNTLQKTNQAPIIGTPLSSALSSQNSQQPKGTRIDGVKYEQPKIIQPIRMPSSLERIDLSIQNQSIASSLKSKNNPNINHFLQQKQNNEGKKSAAQSILSAQQSVYIKNGDDSDDNIEAQMEFSELERSDAHRTIKRSVIKEKNNWSQQFGNNKFARTNAGSDIQKLLSNTNFGEALLMSKQPQHAQTPKNRGQQRQYQMSGHEMVFELSMVSKELKYITVNMLSKNLKFIDLQSNRIQTLPEQVSDLVHLEKLKLDNNNLTCLPQELARLHNLSTLTVCNNNLNELPKNIEHMEKLEILLLNDNKLRELPSRIGLLGNLKKLFLHNNLFQEIPSEISRLEKLKEFSLEWFIYLSPPMPKIMRDSKGLLIIDQVKTFCRNYSPCLINTYSKDQNVGEFRSFGDFILYFHQIKPPAINNLTFGLKQRSLPHQLCINSHTHLLQNIILPRADDLTSSTMISKYIDVNSKDSEGTTPICFAFRANNIEMVELFMESKKVDLNVVSAKYGCPFHLCILKHKFDLAFKMLDHSEANPHITNPNGSNAIHILFANFSFDEDGAETLALKLAQRNVDLNLVDNNGLTPIHVAIKKNQTRALEFAQQYNRSLTNSHIQLAGNLSKQNHSKGFNFNAKGKKDFSPLHYVILKSNYEAFQFLLSQKLVNLFELDETLRSSRSISLINSPFYKILYKLERNYAISLYYQSSKNDALQITNKMQEEQQILKTDTLQETINNYSSNFSNEPKIYYSKKRVHGAKSVDFNQLMNPVELRNHLSSKSNQQTIRKQVPPNLAVINHFYISKRHIPKYLLKTALSTKNQVSTYEKLKPFNKSNTSSGGNNKNHSSVLKAQTKLLLEQLNQPLYQIQQQQSQVTSGSKNQHFTNSKKESRTNTNAAINFQNIKNNKAPIRNKNFDYGNQGSRQAANEEVKRSPANSTRGPTRGKFSSSNNNANPPINNNNVINNIFISNININLNLNINISIPPSPKSTRDNGSRADLNTSLEEKKETTVISQRQEIISSRESQSRLKNDKFIKSIIEKEDGEQEKNEDLSIIDDEMPIKNAINKNLKKDQFQDILHQIQPQICSNIRQQITSANNQNKMLNLFQDEEHKNNNVIFLNTCKVNNGNNNRQSLLDQSEDITQSFRHTPRIINSTSNFTQVVKAFDKETMSIDSNLPTITQNILKSPNKIKQMTLLKESSCNEKITQHLIVSKDDDNRQVKNQQLRKDLIDLKGNRFYNEYMILTDENKPFSSQYQALYSGIVPNLVSRDKKIKEDLKNVIKTLSANMGLTNKLLLADLSYFISQH